MAVYKGREVSILGRSNGEDVSPLYDILDDQGQRSQVKFNELQLTEQEKKDLDKQGVLHLDNAKVIKDKDLQDLRDSQNPDKIKARQEKEHKNKDVAVSKIKVDADEVAQKAK